MRPDLPCKRDPDVFFPSGFTRPYRKQIERAKALCRRCPALRECEVESMNIADRLGAEQFRGVQAGMTPAELQEAARKRRKANAARASEARAIQEGARQV